MFNLYFYFFRFGYFVEEQNVGCLALCFIPYKRTLLSSHKITWFPSDKKLILCTFSFLNINFLKRFLFFISPFVLLQLLCVSEGETGQSWMQTQALECSTGAREADLCRVSK